MAARPLPTLGEPLTPREIQVLSLVATGLSNEEIAGRLFVSKATAKTHMARIGAKLGIGDRAAMVAIGFRRGLLK